MFYFFCIRLILPDKNIFEGKERVEYNKSTPSWFYLYCKNEEKQKCKNYFRNFKPITHEIYTAYLNTTEIQMFNDNNDVLLQEIPFSHKIVKNNFNETTKTYAVTTANTCEIPFKTRSISPDTKVFSSDLDFEEIKSIFSKIDCIRAFERISKPKLHTRYMRASSTSKLNNYSASKNLPYNSRSLLLEKGIDGREQCAAIADTGLDTESCWFSDYGIPVPHNSLKSDHRKILSYMHYTSSENHKYEHGTFVAGIIAGNAECEDPTKMYCSGSFYDGVAPNARLFVQEVVNEETGKLEFSENIGELFELPAISRCGVQLNAWSYERSHLITHAIDHLAYLNSSMLLVFPAGDNETEGIRSPGDAKNVLTVGAIYGDTKIEEQTDPAEAVKLTIDDKISIIGFCDRFAGLSFLDALTRIDLSNFQTGMSIGVDKGQVFLDDNGDRPLEDFVKAGIVIAFHTKPFVGKRLNTSVIRVAAKYRSKFPSGSRIAVSPYSEYTRSAIKPNTMMHPSPHGPVKFYRIKPDILMPGGPILGPRAGARVCSSDGVAVGEGTSVAAALAVGNILLLQQWLNQGYYPTGKRESDNAIQPTSHLIKAILANCADLPPNISRSEGGFGVPHLERFMILPEEYNKSGKHYGTRIYSNKTINAFDAHRFVFVPEDSGVLTATIAWNDPPVDPLAQNEIHTLLDLRVLMPDGRVISANNDINPRSVDESNTLKKLEINVTKDITYEIYVVSGDSINPSSVEYSLVISGPFDHFGDGSCLQQLVANDPPCSPSCSSKEVCLNGWCICRENEVCTQNAHVLDKGKEYNTTATQLEVTYLKYSLPLWNSSISLSFNIEPNDGREFRYLLSINKVPTMDNCECSSVRCEFGEIRKNGFTMRYEDWSYLRRTDEVNIAFYPTENGTTKFKYSINVF